MKYLWNYVFLAGFSICACIAANPVFAIPSPELVIGSVSSLSQLFAVGFAMVSGIVAAFWAKLGFKKYEVQGIGKSFTIFVIALFIVCCGSIMFNIYQNAENRSKEYARLQKTLVRPAQFSGTKILDESLKETSFLAQKESNLGISTAEVAQLMVDKEAGQNTLFIDVRERAEHLMGTLPGAQHIRFPDIETASLDMVGKKVVLLCHNGNRSSETCARLAALGIDCRFITGGLEKWIVEGRDFSDSNVRGLSDLRAIPDYENKDVLISTPEFEKLVLNDDIQIIDTRYPKDFAAGHLPNAINIPIRAMPTKKLELALFNLEQKPTITACYDRRSCFMGQVLGYELAERGIQVLGRYTTPWDYFIAPVPKPHVQKWLLDQNITLWDRSIEILASLLVFVAEKSHFLIAIFALSFISRILILPLALKSEKDQIALALNKDALAELKQRLKGDPVRLSQAVRGFHKRLGLTPIKNLVALLFLPVMMLGLNAVEKASETVAGGFLWITALGESDPFYIFPTTFGVLVGLYLQMTLASTFKRQILSWGLVVPALIALVIQLSAAGVIYLNFSLLLLLQRLYVTNTLERVFKNVMNIWELWSVKRIHNGIIPLQYAAATVDCGNKSHRLSVLLKAGFNVPKGAVVGYDALVNYSQMTKGERSKYLDRLWLMVDRKTCVIRSSGSGEDGAGQSFAGVFESKLNVERSNMQAAFEAVLRSFQSDRANSYHNNQGEGHRGNILAQQMIDAEYSGVLFTQDPIAAGQMLVEMAKGTADDLVSGRVTPLTLRFGKYTHKNCDDLVSPIDVIELLKIGRKVETLFGCPQDIEWAYHRDQFYLVQSRDITTLNLGPENERLRQSEWCGVFERFGKQNTNVPILKQDEMSEILPRPTPLSFSIMASLWTPGGSVDKACRELGLKYSMPEIENGHLYTLFGKVYADVEVKANTTLNFPKSFDNKLLSKCKDIEHRFSNAILPNLAKKLAYWNALDTSKLDLKEQLELVFDMSLFFTNEVYVFAEQINILASYLAYKAESECTQNGLNYLQVMNVSVPYSPSGIIARSVDLASEKQKTYLINAMGHRAVFDYELSTPRYREVPEVLWKISKAHVKPMKFAANDGDIFANMPEIIQAALQFQDLKEHTKHEALRIFALLRDLLLEIDHQFDDEGLVFYLKLKELLKLDKNNIEHTKSIAVDRFDKSQRMKKFAPSKAALTLHECESLSGVRSHLGESGGSTIQGTSVSGGVEVQGTVYHVSELEEQGLDELLDFMPGDILVCKMVNPAWLPYVLQSKAVVCEVGGWLSHMAIVARENNIPMVVGCCGLNHLYGGAQIKVTKAGSIEILGNIPSNMTAHAEFG